MVLDPSTVQATPAPEVAAQPSTPPPQQATTPPPQQTAPAAASPAQQPTQPAPVVPSLPGGPSFTTDAAGNTVEAPDTMRKGPVGLLGRALLGALTGIQGGLQSGYIKPGESGIAASAASAQKYRDEKIQQAKAQASENQKQADVHDEAKLRHNQMMMETANLAMHMNWEKEDHPMVVAAAKADLAGHLATLQSTLQAHAENQLQFMNWLEEQGVDPGTAATSLQQLQGQQKQMVDGPITPIQNGKTGTENGLYSVPTDTLQIPMKTPFTVNTYSGAKDPQTGAFVPTPKVISPGDINPATGKPFSVYDVLAVQMGAHQQLSQLQKQDAFITGQQKAKDEHAESGAKVTFQTAQANNQNAEAAEHNATAHKINQEAKLTDILSPKGSEGLNGEAYLATLPQNYRDAIQAVGEGRQTTSDRNLTTKDGQPTPFAQALYRAYPDYQVQKGRTWQHTQNEYMGSGATAKKVVSYSTSMEHMQDLYDSTTKEGMFNPLSKDYQKRQAAIGFVKQEVGNAVKNGVMTESEGTEIQNGITGGLTPGLNRERVQETAKLLHDKVDEFQTKFQAGAPSSAVKVPTLMSPKAASAYDYVRSGGKVASPQNGQIQSPPATLLKEGTNTTFKNGQTWTLQNGQPVQVKTQGQ
jgi:hypothetical protein